MFIVKKNIKGKDYFYLRESVRENNKVKARTLAYLGKTKSQAEKKAKEFKLKKEKQSMQEENQNKTKPKKQIKPLTIDEISNFCKRKGFVFRSSDIYGGFSGFWDFGPLGTELFNNIKQDWWNFFVKQKQNMLGIDASIISHPRTWKASGHLESFKDIMGKCKKCSKLAKLEEKTCPCGGDLEKVQDFNLMFETKTGADKNSDSVSYLRPETAQAMFMNFKLIAETSRTKLPFGIAQIGRCFRNEIAPRDFLFRTREFHIAELEFFIHPEEKTCNLLTKKHLNLKLNFLSQETQKKAGKQLTETTISQILKQKKLGEWHAYWLAEQILWFASLNLDMQKIKIREHTKDELSHYSSATFDIDYEYPFGSKEVAGIANRGHYDLNQHIKESKAKLEIFDQETQKSVVPRVIEPTFGIERVFLAVLVNAYTYNQERDNIVLKLPPKLAPIKAAVFPIIKKPEYEKLAKQITQELSQEFNILHDKSGSIGRRYSRNDEIGTPMCITIDEQTPKDSTVTIRDRNTTKQVRVKIKDLKDIIRKVIQGENLLNLGKEVKTRVK